MKKRLKNPSPRSPKTPRNSLAPRLKKGAVGVLPTDTIYGLVGSALSPKVVSRIYKLRKRDPEKPFVILISSVSDLKLFGIRLSGKDRRVLQEIWPGPVSVILPVPSDKFRYIHRGLKSIAFRLPAQRNLRELLTATGPLVAPSANWEGKPPARNVGEALRYFGERADFYIDGGNRNSPPSALITLTDGRVKVLRKGVGLKAKHLSDKLKQAINSGSVYAR